jgi:hypothetical protein
LPRTQRERRDVVTVVARDNERETNRRTISAASEDDRYSSSSVATPDVRPTGRVLDRLGRRARYPL